MLFEIHDSRFPHTVTTLINAESDVDALRIFRDNNSPVYDSCKIEKYLGVVSMRYGYGLANRFTAIPHDNTVNPLPKSMIYKAFGIEYVNGKINSPAGLVSPLLINGNAKLGKGVWTFSTLPGTGEFSAAVNGIDFVAKGTCKCDCVGCYAKTGFYRMQSTVNALALRTVIAREYTAFMVNAIIAQIIADGIKLVRIHASGDFFNGCYINAWYEIVKACSDCVFWTYTKNTAAENAFNDLPNINIVKSVIPGIGFNFGHCDYILDAYNALRAAGKSVHICKCGFDKNQHCVNCKGCSENEFVLFVEHSTSYKAIDDTMYKALYDIAMQD